MLNNSNSFESNEYFIDTCCSFNKNDKINLSCRQNEIIHLNLIEIFYNSNPYCSSEYSCCKYRTNCSRRITKYSNLNCNDKNFCSIDKSCLKIYEPCSNIYGLYGQYITIYYSCLTLNNSYSNRNKTNVENSPYSFPFILKFLTSESTTNKNLIIDKKLLLFNNFKSSILSLISIILMFLLVMLIIYSLADQIGNKVCRKKYLKKQNKISFENCREEQKQKVESNDLKQINDIYSTKQICQCYQPYYNYKYPYMYYPMNQNERYLHIQHHPTTGQIYSTTYNPYFNHYTN
ncbi:unnamed protein product [Rotaria magnacalcarata]|uniref:SUEL-type lectin domain-containing protein n=1 Tax=Rotaria magnacalcarata TaxID=392030 RepID=A0A816U6L7_9BILA|nr:unnamed protein product [Rotaria magnacalcarata]CAF1217944.1 unnamed protein product [Rotaria magnacalcarata]CAF2033258.1 unnamed protein product [Rotaria magnacalcarata]CAF2066828.1 unnamed protein product [Rotaria magnacalcarata]CAF2109935.1 unnamed protein product [Rotaria magnacalcarata]